MSFQDYFSKHSGLYALARPRYPDELFQYLSSITKSHNTVWDCGTGNGQAALSLAAHFKKVIGTDASEAQIKNSFKHPGIEYRVATAEDSGLENQSVDLVTAATAAHWFDLKKFYPEARRVLKPGGIIAVWTYTETRSEKNLDEIFHRLGREILDDYWPKGRENVWNKYADLFFPFEEIKAPTFQCRATWNLAELINYLNSWSASQHYASTHGFSPVDLVLSELQKAWADPLNKREIRWELGLRVGKTAQ